MDPRQKEWLDHAGRNQAPYAYQALGDPARTIHIIPAEVTRISRFHQYTKKVHGSKWHDFGRVIDGDWDFTYGGNVNAALEDGPAHLSVFQRYVQGRDWEDTPIFRAKLRSIERKGAVDGRRNRDELLDRYRRLDEVYEHIRAVGWRLEEQVGGYFDSSVSVSISRTGGFLLATGGVHRLAMAKLLRLPSIEVYVLARHAGWQRLREDVAAGRLTYRHPDLEDLAAT